MICATCSEAADSNWSDEEKRLHHAKCKGSTHCDCQHKVGKKGRFIRETR
jgi:hypothetical protein